MTTLVISELQAVAQDVRALEQAARRQAERIERLLSTLTQEVEPSAPGTDPFKRSDGRLTEAGIDAIEAAFAADATLTEVANRFKIQVSAASNRKKIWEAKESKKTAEALKAGAAS